MANTLDKFGTNSDDFFGSTPEDPIESVSNRNMKTIADKESELDPKRISKFTQFTEIGQGYTVSGKTHQRLEAGVYTINISDGIIIFTPKNIKSDKWINFRDGFIAEILAQIELFWKKGDVFKKYEFLQRRGFMFYGPAGTGKSILCKQIMTQIVENDGIVFYCDHPSLLSSGINLFRQIEPDRKITVVFEDIDAIINRYGDSDLLAYLDGEDSNNYIVNIATTNYPERLDKRIISRPRRFDRVIEIGYPDANMREHYFKEKLFMDNDTDIGKWVKATEQFTFAAMTELVISVKCLDIPFDTALTKIKELMEHKPNSSDYEIGKRKVGFGGASVVGFGR